MEKKLEITKRRDNEHILQSITPSQYRHSTVESLTSGKTAARHLSCFGVRGELQKMATELKAT